MRTDCTIDLRQRLSLPNAFPSYQTAGRGDVVEWEDGLGRVIGVVDCRDIDAPQFCVAVMSGASVFERWVSADDVTRVWQPTAYTRWLMSDAFLATPETTAREITRVQSHDLPTSGAPIPAPLRSGNRYDVGPLTATGKLEYCRIVDGCESFRAVHGQHTLRSYDNGSGKLYVYQDASGLFGVVRADSWEDAYSTVVDEILSDAEPDADDIAAMERGEDVDGIAYRGGVPSDPKIGTTCLASVDLNGESLERLTLAELNRLELTLERVAS